MIEKRKANFDWNEYLECLIEASGTVRLLYQREKFIPSGERVEVSIDARLKKNIERIAKYNSKSVDEFLFLISEISINMVLEKRKERNQFMKDQEHQSQTEEQTEEKRSSDPPKDPQLDATKTRQASEEKQDLILTEEEKIFDEKQEQEMILDEKVATLPPLELNQKNDQKQEKSKRQTVSNKSVEEIEHKESDSMNLTGADSGREDTGRKKKDSSDKNFDQKSFNRQAFEKTDQINSFEKLLEMENFNSKDRENFFKIVHEFLDQNPQLEENVFSGLYISMSETVLQRFLDHIKHKYDRDAVMQKKAVPDQEKGSAEIVEQAVAESDPKPPLEKNRMKVIEGIELMTFDEKDRIKNYEQLLWLKTAYQENEVVEEFTDIVMEAIERKKVKPPERLYDHLYITLTPDLLQRHIRYLEHQSDQEEEKTVPANRLDPIIVKTKIAGLNKEMFRKEDVELLDDISRNVNPNNAGTFMQQLSIILKRNEIEDTAIHSLQISLKKTTAKRTGLKKLFYNESKAKNELMNLLVQVKYANLVDDTERIQLEAFLKEYAITPQALLEKLILYK